MSLSDEARALVPANGSVCRVGVLLAALGPSERDELEEALADPGVPNSGLARALKLRGHTIGDYTLNRHRKGGCLCPR